MTPHHSSKTSILVNGSPTFEFSIKRGLRQGNPISPFLFILVMEGLHVALSNAVQSGLIHGVKFGSPAITLSHLFYADDVMITTEWSSHDMDNIIHLLLDRFLSRLSSWKANLLFIDRLTLIKVFLESLEIYYLSIFKAPESVLKAMKRIRAMFFLGESQDSKKLAWIKWSNVLSSFDKGGLGIGSLKSFNLALLQKWHWRFISNPKLLWVKAIKALHGQEGGILTFTFFPLWSTTWDKSLPRKVNIFMWRLLLDRLPHRLNLSYQGIEKLRSLALLVLVMQSKTSISFSSVTLSKIFGGWFVLGVIPPCLYTLLMFIGKIGRALGTFLKRRCIVCMSSSQLLYGGFGRFATMPLLTLTL
ncbi:RNA-directed DNA polymerase, eukaryota, reverse transcriptase zinc-binding domain protein [Tanacetum coccineum]